MPKEDKPFKGEKQNGKIVFSRELTLEERVAQLEKEIATLLKNKVQ